MYLCAFSVLYVLGYSFSFAVIYFFRGLEIVTFVAVVFGVEVNPATFTYFG